MSEQHRVVVITGATGVLGRVVAQAFARQGARLVLASTDLQRLQQVTAELNLPPEHTLLHAANFRDPHAAQALAQAAYEWFGRIDMLLHLVGGWVGGKTIVEVETSDAEHMLQQHLWTTWHLAQAFAPRLTANNWGRIIVISSPSATQPPTKGAPYAIAKAAQETLILALAQELRGTGVTANILQVQAIDTRHERDRERSPQHASGTTPEEITAAVLYLCSEQAQTVSGVRIPLYGSL